MTIKKALLVTGTIAMTFAAAVAHAQQAAPEKPLTLTVTVPELNVIGKALGKMPFEDVAQLMAKLQQQVTQQQAPSPGQAPAPAPTPPSPTPEPAPQ